MEKYVGYLYCLRLLWFSLRALIHWITDKEMIYFYDLTVINNVIVFLCNPTFSWVGKDSFFQSCSIAGKCFIYREWEADSVMAAEEGETSGHPIVH